jgi:hypothetical protein
LGGAGAAKTQNIENNPMQSRTGFSSMRSHELARRQVDPAPSI